MTLIDLFKNNRFENSLVVGYFGGTNYGDELLLEILQGLLYKNGTKKAAIYYTQPKLFKDYHNDFGYKIINPSNKIAFLKELIRSKSIVIGGGGLWGLDSNIRILLLGFLLVFSRFVLFKKVYIISVGYYNSANFYGKLGARLAAISATKILVRDNESYDNFKKFTNKVSLDKDLSSYIYYIDLSLYKEKVPYVVKLFRLDEPVLIFGMRRFNSKKKQHFTKTAIEAINKTSHKNIIVATFEDLPETRQFIEELKSQINNNNVSFISYNLNPITFFLALQQYKQNISIIAPQYHIQIIANINKIPFLPVAYDNKVKSVHKEVMDLPSIEISTLTDRMILDFINKHEQPIS